MNIQGLKPRTVPSKIPFIREILYDKDQVLFALTETWLYDHLPGELQISGYTLFRQDRCRTKKRGRSSGGTAIYMKDNIAVGAKTILEYSSGVIEILGVEIKSLELVLFVAYRQPDDPKGGYRSNSAEFKIAMRQITELLSSYPSPSPKIIICGDFNLPHAMWPSSQWKAGCGTEEQRMIKELSEICNEYFLKQCIEEATHKGGNTLDLLLTNDADLLHSYVCNKTIFSDHYIIECCVIDEKAVGPKPIKETLKEENCNVGFDTLNFFSEEINWEELNVAFETYDWKREFRALSPDHMLQRFIEVSLSFSMEYVPKRKSFKKSVNIIPKDRRILMRRRNTVNKCLKDANLYEDRRKKLCLELTTIEKALKKSYDEEMSYQEEKAVQAIKRNTKYFYNYAKKFHKIKTNIGPLMDGHEIISDPKKMADKLSDQYSAMFSIPMNPMESPTDIFDIKPGGPKLDNIIFYKEDIVEAIEEISSTAAPGPDRYPAVLLKMCKNTLCFPLFLIWRKSLDCGTVPSLLKDAIIAPIHKGGDKGMAKNYRPVALTSHLIKLFEKVIRKHLISHLEENNLLNEGQHGFRIGRSCLSQLISHYDSILRLLEEGENVDIIYLDFAKAFDKVDILITLKKLNNLRVTGKIGNWIYSFLNGRTQSVSVSLTKSEPKEVTSGVPQGSVLGPVLFLILIGDINSEVTSSFVSSFADDTRIGRGISRVEDVAILQNDLELVYDWAERNNMKFNIEKFECLRYGRHQEVQTCTAYHCHDVTIGVKEEVRDLGIKMSSTGLFNRHIEESVESAKLLAGWIFRTFKTRMPDPMLSLWKTLVLPKLDYCSQLWSPNKAGAIQQLEMVQRSFVRKITGVNNLNYWSQLKMLKIYSLERRRERYTIIYVWKILEGLVPNVCSVLEGGIQSHFNIRLGRKCYLPSIKRRSPPYVKNLRENALNVRGPRLFNILPAEIRNITKCCVDAFKRKLDVYLRKIPDEPQVVGYTSMRCAPSNSIIDMASALRQRTPVMEGTGRYP